MTDTYAQPVQPQTEVQPEFIDYWGTNETYRFELGDGKQFFEVRPMDEGAKAKFQKLTNSGLRVNQKTQDATIDVDPANERWTLIQESVIGWMLMQRLPSGEWTQFPAPHSNESSRRTQVRQILEKFNPKVIQDLEFFIRTKNPWMQADMDVAEIDKEIERLEEMKKQKLEQDAGEASSTSK